MLKMKLNKEIKSTCFKVKLSWTSAISNHIKSQTSSLVKNMLRTFCLFVWTFHLDIFPSKRFFLWMYLYCIYRYTTVYLIFSVSKPVCCISADWLEDSPCVSSACDLDCATVLRKTLSLCLAAPPAERKSNLHTLHCRGSSSSCLLMDWGPEGLSSSIMLALVLQLNPGVRSECFSRSLFLARFIKFFSLHLDGKKSLFYIFVNSISSTCFPGKTNTVKFMENSHFCISTWSVMQQLALHL